MNQKVIVFSGNPKAASTWLGGLLTGISIEMGKLVFYGQYSIPENFKKIQNGNYEVIVSQSSNYKRLKELKLDYSCVHVIRDPRDVCVSSYFSYKKTHDIGGWNELGELRNRLNKKSFEEGMIDIIHFNQYFFEQLEQWNYFDKSVLELKYEEILDSPEKTIVRICEFLKIHASFRRIHFSRIIGILNRVMYRIPPFYSTFRIRQDEIPTDRVLNIYKGLSFDKLAKGRNRGDENITSHYRKGIKGDWKNYFNERLKNDFKKQYGDLLIQLGYEKDHAW